MLQISQKGMKKLKLNKLITKNRFAYKCFIYFYNDTHSIFQNESVHPVKQWLLASIQHQQGSPI